MQFESFSAFWAMNGYGTFVWLSFGISFLVLGGLTFLSYLQKQWLFNKAKQELQRAERIKAARARQKEKES